MRSLLLAILALLPWPLARAEEAGKGAAAPREITVQVVGGGQPIKAAKVYIRQPLDADDPSTRPPDTAVLTDEHGRAKVTFQRSRALVMVIADQYAPQQKIITAPAPAEDVKFLLERGIPFKFRVIWSDGRPMADTPLFFDNLPSVHDFHVFHLAERPTIGHTDAEGWIIWPHAPPDFVLIGIPNFQGGITAWMLNPKKDANRVLRPRAEE